jgi:chromosome segregation ATPase
LTDSSKAKKKTKKKRLGGPKQDAPHVDAGANVNLNGEDEEDQTVGLYPHPKTMLMMQPIESPIKDETPTVMSAPTPPANGFSLSEQLDALAVERDSLRYEVAELRQLLEDIRGNHKDEVQELKDLADKAEEEREHAEQQHANLLERVKDIRSTLGERMKSNAEELTRATARIEEVEEENVTVRDANAALEETIARLRSEYAQNARDTDSFRERTNLSQQNWVKEREELMSKEAYAREEYETARQAMQDWEVLAMEERSLRENLSEKVGDLEDRLATLKESYERALSERDGQAQAVDGLQRALRELQEGMTLQLDLLILCLPC